MNSNSDKFCKLFVGSIPHTVVEEELKAEFAKYGTISSLFYMSDKGQDSRGWALITYQTSEEAKSAILNLDTKFKFPGSEKPLEVRYADKKSEKTENSSSLMNRNTSPWIEYLSPSKHPYYYNSLTGATQWERPLEMDAAPASMGRSNGLNSLAAAAGNTSYGPRGSNLFIFHIPADWNDSELIQHFQHYGNIRSARIQRDSAGRNRGFGFVSFDNVQSARNAIRGMNGFNVGTKYLKVKVKKGEEDANDEGLDTQGMGNLYNKMSNMVNPFPYTNQLPGAAAHMHPAAMYAPYAPTMRSHIQHYSPY